MQAKKQESWKDIAGFSEDYAISNLGRFKQKNFLHHKGKINITTGTKMSNGYLKIQIKKRGINKLKLVHRLVAEHFIPNPNNLPFVNHKDGDKTNNNVSNLEWCSPKENNRHQFLTGLNKGVFAVNSKRAVPVIQLALDGCFIAEYENLTEMQKQTGFSKSNVLKHINGHPRYNTAYKSIWRLKTNPPHISHNLISKIQSPINNIKL